MLIPAISSRYDALIELTRDSYLLERRITPITEELNSFPLRVNKVTWLSQLDEAEEAAHLLTDYCRVLADDHNFRPNSPKDCSLALFPEKPNQVSTDKDVLSELANGGSKLAGAILEARSAIARYSQLKAWGIHAELGHVQAYWDSLGTPHGRYTSEEPCLSNRIEPIRATIEPPQDWSFLSLDLSQCEYVVWASLSKDEVLSQAFTEGRDFHIEMAVMIKSLVPAWNPQGDLRDAGKLLNFAILYQMKPHTLARKLGCSVDLAEQIIRVYYKSVPDAALYIADVLARAEEFGYVETFYGRRRYCSEYQQPMGEKETHELSKTLWSHVNAGTAAELCKLKQCRIWEALRHAGFTTEHARLSVQMYDGLVWSVRDDCMDDVRFIAEEEWTKCEEGFLNFRSKTNTGKTWEEATR